MRKMTRDLLENADQIMADAKALHEIGASYDGWGITPSFTKYFEEHYEIETVQDDSLFGGEVMTEEQQDVYRKYTAKVGSELLKLNFKR